MNEMLYPCSFCVALLMDRFVLCVACLLGVVVILLLNLMEVLRMGGGSLLDTSCMIFQIMFVLYL